MATVKVPLGTEVYTNVDGIELNDKQALLIDGYKDELGATVSRPGLSLSVNLGTNAPVDGIFYWSHKDVVYAVSAGKIFRLTNSTGTITATDVTGTDKLNAGVRVSFTVGMTTAFVPYLMMANGGRIVYTDNSATPAYLADANAPTSVSHLAQVDGYVLANNLNTNQWKWSDPSTPLTWNALNFANASSDADFLTSIRVLNREIYLLGDNSVELWENDGESPFSRVPGGYIQTGISAPYSVVNTENGIFWLDNKRKFVLYNGKSVERIATPYEKTIQAFNSVRDATAEKIEMLGKTFLVFQFPSQNQTLVYNQTDDNWSRWGSFNPTTGAYNRWKGDCYTLAENWGMHLIGASDGKIYQINPNVYADVSDHIKLYRLSGHIDYGVSKEKRSKQFRVRVKTGAPSIGRTPKLMIRWKDNNRNSWSNEHWIELGNQGESDIVKIIYATGIFRTRQYELSISDPVPGIFVDAEEDIEVLR